MQKMRPLTALVTVALIGAGGSYGFAASGTTGKIDVPRPKGPSAPGNTPPARSSRPVRPPSRSAAPGVLPPTGSPRPVITQSVPPSAAPGTLPPMGSS
jgi:hypothetical protein